MNDDDTIPSIETYRDVPIHAFQPRERVEEIVKPAIDLVATTSDAGALFEHARDPYQPPESRLYAAAKIRAAHEIAATSRIERPNVDLQLLQAHTVGLGSFRLIDLHYYTSLYALRPKPRPDHPHDRRPQVHVDEILEEEARREALGLKVRSRGRNAGH